MKELGNQYRADPVATSKMHIRDCIEEVCRRKSITLHRAPRLSTAIYSTLQLVLDGIAYGDSQLNEVDSNGQTPLQLAIEQDLPEGIELLLAKGASSAVVSTRCSHQDQWPGRYRDKSPCTIKQRYNLIKCWEDGGSDVKSMRIASFAWGGSWIGTVERIGMNLANVFPPMYHGHVTEGLKIWIHVPVTSVRCS